MEKRLVQHSAAPPLQLLDIGFGLGYNCMSAIEAAQNTNTRIEIISLENDPAVIAQALSAGIGGLSQRFCNVAIQLCGALPGNANAG